MKTTTNPSRRKFIYTSAVLSAGLSFGNFSTFAKDKKTPKAIPHFVNPEKFENNLRKNILFGENPIRIKGRVYDGNKALVKGAKLTLWHNDEDGVFHKHQYRGKILSDSKGNYTFSSYKPGKYIKEDGYKSLKRLFLLVEAKGYEPQLNTVYFTFDNFANIDGETYEKSSIIPRPSLPIAQMKGGELQISYDIYIKRTNEPIKIADQTPNIEVYPNPVVSEAYVDIDGDQLGEVSVTLLDLNGREINRFEIAKDGFQKVALPVSNLGAGIYFVRINSEIQGMFTKKFLVRR
ncbi:MAG: T9SS type A sorting domain-containing protein [Flammeovirgaceae bacterium]